MDRKKGVAVAGVAVALGCGVLVLAAQTPGGQGSQRNRRTLDALPGIEQRLNVLASGRQLGVTLRELNTAEARDRKLPSTESVIVESVQAKGAAEKAGMKVGDVIAEFGGEPVRSIRQLRRLLSETPEGQPVKVGVIRDGHRVDLSVTPDPARAIADLDALAEQLRRGIEGGLLRDLPRQFFYWDDPAPGQGSPQRDPPIIPRFRGPQYDFRWPRYEWSPGAGRLGVVVQQLTPQLADYFFVKDGVLVATVTPDSAASRAGLRAGDVITAIDGKTMKAPDDVVQFIRAVPDGQEIAIAVVRDHKALTIKTKLAGTKSPWHV